MSLAASDWLAIAGALGVIAWVNWYFFLADRGAAVAAGTSPGGPAEVAIVVRGGYSPATVRARAGAPVRLVFDRQETSGCSEEVVFGDFGVRKYLPADQRTAIEITPPAPGTYEFTCGMGMLRGKVVAE